MNKAQFITLEGGEGVGKTTNLDFIQQLLAERQIPVLLTREPGGTALAEKIRGLLLATEEENVDSKAELLLMFAARKQHLEQLIKPALDKGVWVICDRFTDATYAYQGGGRGVDDQQIAWLEQFVQDDLRPDLTLLLDAPVHLGMERAQERGRLDRFEQEQLLFFQQVRNIYLRRAEEQSQRIKKIDASQPLQTVQAQIQQIIEDSFFSGAS